MSTCVLCTFCFVLQSRNRNIKFIFLRIRLNANFITVLGLLYKLTNKYVNLELKVFHIICASRASLRWTQRPPLRRSTWRTCRSMATRTRPTNISRLPPPKVFLSTKREEGVNLALDRWGLLKLYSSCKRNHKPCHDWSQRKTENSNYILGEVRFPSNVIRSFLFSPHKIISLSIINFCFVLCGSLNFDCQKVRWSLLCFLKEYFLLVSSLATWECAWEGY